MAMRICRECGKEISKSAKVCPNCGKEYKHNSAGIVVLCIFLVMIIAGISSTSNNSKTSNSTDNQNYFESVESKINSINENKITLQKFNEIKTGMTYSEVVSIIGEEGTVLSETDIGDSRYKTTIYNWYASNGIANANVTIQGGKVVSKAQFGLK